MARDVEDRVREAFLAGDVLDLSIPDRSGEDAADPAGGADWGPDRTVPADLIADLLARPVDRSEHPLPGLWLVGAKVVGELDLAHAEITVPAVFTGCWWEQAPDFFQARAEYLGFVRCRLPGLSGRLLVVRGDLDCDDSTFTGAVRLQHARVDGDLGLINATLLGSDGYAMSASGLTVNGNLFARNGFTARGEIGLIGAHITNTLDLTGATLDNPDGIALDANRVTVDGSVYLSNGFAATGEICLISADIGSNLELNDASLTHPGGDALNAADLTVGGNLLGTDGFTVTGGTDLRAARIGGVCELTGAVLTGSSGYALNAADLTAGGGLNADEGFAASGGVNLRRAHLGAGLDLDGATLTAPGERALNAIDLTVDGTVDAGAGFTATGQVDLTGARVTADLDLTGATLVNPGGVALMMSSAQIGQAWLRFATPPDGTVSLVGSHIKTVIDHPASWPAEHSLGGLTYGELEARSVPATATGPNQLVPIGVQQRLDWLRRDPDPYSPQPYEQLAAYYRRTGREGSARRVLLEKQRRRRRTLPVPGRVASWLLDGLVGYGYRNWLAVVWLVALWALGTVAFLLRHPVARDPADAPAYHPAIHALDLLLPVVSFGQDDAWRPVGFTQWVAYLLIAAGWVLTTAVVAGLTRLLNRG